MSGVPWRIFPGTMVMKTRVMIAEIIFLEGGDTAVRGTNQLPGQNQSKKSLILSCQKILRRIILEREDLLWANPYDRGQYQPKLNILYFLVTNSLKILKRACL